MEEPRRTENPRIIYRRRIPINARDNGPVALLTSLRRHGLIGRPIRVQPVLGFHHHGGGQRQVLNEAVQVERGALFGGPLVHIHVNPPRPGLRDVCLGSGLSGGDIVHRHKDAGAVLICVHQLGEEPTERAMQGPGFGRVLLVSRARIIIKRLNTERGVLRVLVLPGQRLDVSQGGPPIRVIPGCGQRGQLHQGRGWGRWRGGRR